MTEEPDDAYTKLLTKLSNDQVHREIDRLRLQHDIVAPLLANWINSYAASPSSPSCATAADGYNRNDDDSANNDTANTDGEEPLVFADIGCGPGHDVDLTFRVLRERNLQNNVRIIGIDTNDQLLRQAQQRYEEAPTITFQKGSITSIPLPHASVDFILVKFVIQHIEGEARMQALREIRRVLKPGRGRALIVDVDDGTGSFICPEPDHFQMLMMRQFAERAIFADRLVVRKILPLLRKVGFGKIRLHSESVAGGHDHEFSFAQVMQIFYNWRFTSLREQAKTCGDIDTEKVNELEKKLKELESAENAFVTYPIFLIVAQA